MYKSRLMKTILLTAAFGSVFAAGVFAKDTLTKVEAYLRPDFKLEVDGKIAALGNPPLIYDGNSYLPLRMMGELLGVQVGWEESTQTIKVSRPSGAAGTGTVSTGSTGTAAPAPSTSGMVPDKEIVLNSLARYELSVNVTGYPVLANLHKGSVYLRWSDLSGVPLPFGNPPLSIEKLTKEAYVLIDLIKPMLSETATMNLLQTPIVTGDSDSERIHTLVRYFGTHTTAYSVKLKGTSPYEYEVLAQSTTDRRFQLYTVRLNKVNDTQWSVSGASYSSLTE